jgi:hypothetical protein
MGEQLYQVALRNNRAGAGNGRTYERTAAEPAAVPAKP